MIKNGLSKTRFNLNDFLIFYQNIVCFGYQSFLVEKHNSFTSNLFLWFHSFFLVIILWFKTNLNQLDLNQTTLFLVPLFLRVEYNNTIPTNSVYEWSFAEPTETWGIRNK